jgi:hypothetical protein
MGTYAITLIPTEMGALGTPRLQSALLVCGNVSLVGLMQLLSSVAKAYSKQ